MSRLTIILRNNFEGRGEERREKGDRDEAITPDDIMNSMVYSFMNGMLPKSIDRGFLTLTLNQFTVLQIKFTYEY